MNRTQNVKRLVYLSIDDVGPSLRYLTRNRPDSLFDMRFYGKLREWHVRFGARFCLYCFSRLEDFVISEVSDQYAKEFQASGEWLRVHCWRATPEQTAFLREQGVRVLLSPDELSPSYDPGSALFEDGLEHWQTDVRFEQLVAVDAETLRIGAERVVTFTHEWAFDEHVHQIEESLALYKKHGYHFCCLQKETGNAQEL